MKKYLILIFVLFFIGGVGWWLLFSKFEYSPFRHPERPKEAEGSLRSSAESGLGRDDNIQNDITTVAPPNSSTTVSPAPTTISNIRINVPFASQAPTANWDEVHEETCEEAAAVMTAYALAGKKLNPQTMEDELTKLITWEKEKFGFFEDTTAEQTAKIMTDYFGLNSEVVYSFDLSKIKEAIDGGKLAIGLFAGQKLNNPNFKHPGPVYHALVIKDYKGNKIITNDPGTRKGENYIYDFETLKNASREWVGDKEKILEGRPNMIIVSKS